MTREPDRYDKQAGELARYVKAEQASDFMREIAAALRREHDAALDEAAREADALAEAPGVAMGGPYALALVARKIRALASPAAAPAAPRVPELEPQTWCGVPIAPPSEPAAPAHGVEDVARAHRRYDAMAVHPLDPLVRVIVEPCELGGHYRNRNGVTFHPSPCVEKPPGAGEGTT